MTREAELEKKIKDLKKYLEYPELLTSEKHFIFWKDFQKANAELRGIRSEKARTKKAIDNDIIDKILDMTSSIDPRYNERWGHDTNVGNADELREQVRKILLKKLEE
jgi:hypothetical protein